MGDRGGDFRHARLTQKPAVLHALFHASLPGMSKHHQPQRHPPRGSESPIPQFEPVALRFRHDGWHAEKQVAFIQALADSACVDAACARVGMSVKSAYALRARPEALSFRHAWEAALAQAIQRLSDAALSRAIHGVPRPVFFGGEQVGEWRHFDERLTMFLLRYRDPDRYGKFNDDMVYQPGQPDGAVRDLANCLLRILQEAGVGAAAGSPAPGGPSEAKPEGEAKGKAEGQAKGEGDMP